MSCGKNIDYSHRYETTSSATCKTCNAILSGRAFWVRDDKAMCAECYFRLAKTGDDLVLAATKKVNLDYKERYEALLKEIDWRDARIVNLCSHIVAQHDEIERLKKGLTV